MKHPVNFRLSEEALHALALLSKNQGVSRTEVVEQALRRMNRETGAGRLRTKRGKKPHPLAEFAGIWSNVDVEAMLAAINEPVPPSDNEALFP